MIKLTTTHFTSPTAYGRVIMPVKTDNIGNAVASYTPLYATATSAVVRTYLITCSATNEKTLGSGEVLGFDLMRRHYATTHSHNKHYHARARSGYVYVTKDV